MKKPDEYLIMDARAVYDVDLAAVLEAYGQKCPSKAYLKRNWPEGSVIVRLTDWDGKAFCKSEVIWL